MTALAFFIMPAPTTLYDASLDPIVNLPAGYFVLQSDTDAPDGYIKVAYDDLTGYVKSSTVVAVDYTPVTKYEKTVMFRCDNDGQPVNLRATPKKDGKILSVLSSTQNGRCYGAVTGETLIKDGGNRWYYVNIDGMRGYCYYAHISVDTTPPNIIEKEPDKQSDNPVTAPPVSEENSQSMSSTAAIIFIVALCIPVPFIMYYLFRKPKDKE